MSSGRCRKRIQPHILRAEPGPGLYNRSTESVVKPSLLIVSPDYPPRRGGVADHTQRLAREFAREYPVSVLTSEGDSQDDWAKVYPLIDDWTDLDALFVALESIPRVDFVLWQYVPHMYGHGGVNLKLPHALWHLQKHQRPQLVLAHEIAAPYSAWPHRFYYAWAHRSQWRRLLHGADALGISTEAWLEDWKQQRPDIAHKLFLAPSPSNIEFKDCPADHRAAWRTAHDLPANVRVMTYFGTLDGAKRFDWVAQAWDAAQAKQPTALIAIGGRPDWEPTPELAALYRPLGFLDAPAVSQALQAADVLTLPFIDGVSERRTSFMAGLSHGTAAITTLGENTGPHLRAARCFASVAADDLAAFKATVADLLENEPRRRELGREATEVYARHYAWLVLINRIKEAMQAVNPG